MAFSSDREINKKLKRESDSLLKLRAYRDKFTELVDSKKELQPSTPTMRQMIKEVVEEFEETLNQLNQDIFQKEDEQGLEHVVNGRSSRSLSRSS